MPGCTHVPFFSRRLGPRSSSSRASAPRIKGDFPPPTGDDLIGSARARTRDGVLSRPRKADARELRPCEHRLTRGIKLRGSPRTGSPEGTGTHGHDAAAKRWPPGRVAELEELAQKIAKYAYRVTDGDIAALKARYSEDEIFEIVIAACLGPAMERLRLGLRALEDA